MRKALMMVVGMSLAAISCQTPERAVTRPHAPRLEPFIFRSFDGRTAEAELGRLQVPADRDAPDARSVTLAYVRLPSTSPHPGPPIVFLAGGPGIPGVGIARVPPYASLFLRLRDTADVILLDQRGTGMSESGLACGRLALPETAFASSRSMIPAIAEQAAACATEVRSRGVEPSDFNVEESADDLEDLRQALGAERLDLLAWSYGGEVALAALRRHPQSFDRVVLAGARSPDRLLKSPASWDAQFRALSALAASDPTAAALTPDLYAAARRVFAALDARPLQIEIQDRATAAPVTLTVGRLGLQTLVRLDLSDLRAAARLPALISSVERGDYSILQPRLEQLYNSFSVSMSLATDCASGWSRARRRAVDAEAQMAMLDNVNIQWSPEICTAIGATDLGDDYRRAVRSDTATLLISGELDPNAPPSQAEEIRRGFSAATHIVFRNVGHETLPVETVQDYIARFLAREHVADASIDGPALRFSSLEEARAAASPPGRQ